MIFYIHNLFASRNFEQIGIDYYPRLKRFLVVHKCMLF